MGVTKNALLDFENSLIGPGVRYRSQTTKLLPHYVTRISTVEISFDLQEFITRLLYNKSYIVGCVQVPNRS